VLLAGSLKFEGTLTLQLRGDGRVSMLVAQATSDLTLRGVVQLRQTDAADVDVALAASSDTGDLRALIGNGQMIISVEQGDAPAWQGVVPLDGASLAACLESYFESSEQLSTRFVFAANEQRAAGVLLQKMPGATGEGEAAAAQGQLVWEEAGLLLATLGGGELLAVEPQQLLPRVFAGHDLRLLDGDAVRFACRCSRERVARMLESLGGEEVQGILAEDGEVTVTCEFCKMPYRFDAVDVGRLFAGGASGGGAGAGVPVSVN
jgi:molecular chaperone Hsp33